MSEKDFYLYVGGKPVKVSEDVYREYKHGEDKERYFMRRLKKGRFLIDAEAQTVTYIPSREESYNHLLDADWEFSTSSEAVAELKTNDKPWKCTPDCFVSEISSFQQNSLRTLAGIIRPLMKKLFPFYRRVSLNVYSKSWIRCTQPSR